VADTNGRAQAASFLELMIPCIPPSCGGAALLWRLGCLRGDVVRFHSPRLLVVRVSKAISVADLKKEDKGRHFSFPVEDELEAAKDSLWHARWWPAVWTDRGGDRC
jgi:hypothetical protein